MKRATRRVLAACLVAELVAAVGSLYAAEFYVAPGGDNDSPGTRAEPFRTIQRAADVAQSGDVITVREGVYREWISPMRGGVSSQQPIVFQAAPGEKVEIKGSEIVKNWELVQPDVWKTSLPNSFFGDFNPYCDLIHGDWFNPKGRQHHTGAVYLNGDWLAEAVKLAEVLGPIGIAPLWFSDVEGENTTIWAQFENVDPNEELVEINVRPAVFYPVEPRVDYVTVRGFALRHAAAPWAPPTAEQIGLIGTHWSKGWIIENNVISHSTCSGLSLGKYGDQWDNTSEDTAEGYVETIERALQNGWNKETIGHHIVRNNTISHCEQAGIVGSLGAAFSTISGNVIHDVHVRRLFSGAEMAGIKLHAAIDVAIRDNHIHRSYRGLWLDWMAQGTRVSGNLFRDNDAEDLFVEVNHGPFLVDNNVFLSEVSLRDVSQGGAYVHNLWTGKFISQPEFNRSTPYLQPHSTAVAGFSYIEGADNRFYNNIFVGRDQSVAVGDKSGSEGHRDASGYGLCAYNARAFPVYTGGNVYYAGAQPYCREVDCVVSASAGPKVSAEGDGSELFLQLTFGQAAPSPCAALVTTELLGTAKISGHRFESRNGSPLQIDADYFGKKRNEANPTAGPFVDLKTGTITLHVR